MRLQPEPHQLLRSCLQSVELDLPNKVKIGLSAGNISAKPFTAQFENFALINNDTQIDADVR